MPACLQLVSSDLWLLVFLRGVSVKHRLFSYSQNVKLQLTLEIRSHRMSSLSSAIQQPTIHPYSMSTVIKTVLTTPHHRIGHNSLKTHSVISKNWLHGNTADFYWSVFQKHYNLRLSLTSTFYLLTKSWEHISFNNKMTFAVKWMIMFVKESLKACERIF